MIAHNHLKTNFLHKNIITTYIGSRFLPLQPFQPCQKLRILASNVSISHELAAGFSIRRSFPPPPFFRTLAVSLPDSRGYQLLPNPLIFITGSFWHVLGIARY
jgi:hypothetical protein